MVSTQEGYFSDKEKFKAGRGKFNVAFAFISFDGDERLDEDYSAYG